MQEMIEPMLSLFEQRCLSIAANTLSITLPICKEEIESIESTKSDKRVRWIHLQRHIQHIVRLLSESFHALDTLSLSLLVVNQEESLDQQQTIEQEKEQEKEIGRDSNSNSDLLIEFISLLTAVVMEESNTGDM
jgi:hypothetical protein